MWEPGLPAMQAPRSFIENEAMLSQASQLPHKPAPTQARSHKGLYIADKLYYLETPCPTSSWWKTTPHSPS